MTYGGYQIVARFCFLKNAFAFFAFAFFALAFFALAFDFFPSRKIAKFTLLGTARKNQQQRQKEKAKLETKCRRNKSP